MAHYEQKEFPGFSSRALHAGQAPDKITGSVVVPISMASTFAQPEVGRHTGFEYSRTGNPTRKAFEDCIAALEEAKFGFAFGSGSAASATLVNMLNSGDHIVSVDDVYGGSNRYFRKVAKPAMNIDTTFVDMNDEEAFEAAFTEKTKMVWLETPSNPTLKITDIKKAAARAKAHNCIIVVDNTFASPALQTPLNLGADIVLHSVSKYIGGHSDVVMGFVATNDEALATKIGFLQNSIGAIPSPFDSYMALRGVRTLKVRMNEHCKNALELAKWLEAHPKIDRVTYPGLESHPQHEIAKEQMRGFGGMITFYLKGGLEEAKSFLNSLKLIILAESLGCVESLVESPALMTHAAVPAEQRKILGIDDSMVRFSVGIEDIEDLKKDLTNALANI